MTAIAHFSDPYTRYSPVNCLGNGRRQVFVKFSWFRQGSYVYKTIYLAYHHCPKFVELFTNHTALASYFIFFLFYEMELEDYCKLRIHKLSLSLFSAFPQCISTAHKFYLIQPQSITKKQLGTVACHIGYACTRSVERFKIALSTPVRRVKAFVLWAACLCINLHPLGHPISEYICSSSIYNYLAFDRLSLIFLTVCLSYILNYGRIYDYFKQRHSHCQWQCPTGSKKGVLGLCISYLNGLCIVFPYL